MYPLSWNTLPYIGKFDGQTAFGVYGLAATYTIPTKLYNPVATHTPYNAATADLRLRPVYGCGHSTVAANLRLRPIYGYGQSTVSVNLRLQPLYGCSQSTVTANIRLRPIYGYGQSTVVATLFCYYGLSTHYSYSYAIFRLYAFSECNFGSIVYLQ